LTGPRPADEADAGRGRKVIRRGKNDLGPLDGLQQQKNVSLIYVKTQFCFPRTKA